MTPVCHKWEGAGERHSLLALLLVCHDTHHRLGPPSPAEAEATYTDRYVFKGCLQDEDKLGDDGKSYFGSILGARFTTASAYASSYGGPGAYFAVARARDNTSSPTALGFGFVVNGSVGSGLRYTTPSDDPLCSTPCADDITKKCGSRSADDSRASGRFVWAVYGPATPAGGHTSAVNGCLGDQCC